MRGDLDRWASLATAWVIFAICCVAPIASMLLGAAESELFSNVASLLGERQRTLMANTVALGIGVAALALSIGAPLGAALARCDMRRVAIWRFVLIFPLIVPSFVLGLAWIVLAGAGSSQWVYSLPAATVVLGFSLYPIVMLATEAAVRSVSSRLEEAGRLVASTSRVWLKIIVPLIAPPVVASLLIVFVLCIADFAVPGLLRVRVYTTEVFTAFAALYDFALATVTAMPLAAIAALASLIAVEVIQRPLLSRSERSPAGLTWTEKRQRIAAVAIGVFAIGLVLPPIAAVALEARRGGLPLGDGVSLVAIQNSVVWSASAATLVVCVAVLLGYWRINASRRLARAADALWVTLFAIPAAVIGVGMITLWNRPGFLGAFHGTEPAIVMAYLSRFLPLGALLCAGFLQRVTIGCEEAARLSGASWTRTFVRIVLPTARNGIVAVWLLMFILMSGEVALTILLAPPGESNLPVRTYTLIANAPTGDVARLALLQIGISAVPLFLITVLLGHRRSGPGER
jgi:iron(III) transport system permease protein